MYTSEVVHVFNPLLVTGGGDPATEDRFVIHSFETVHARGQRPAHASELVTLNAPALVIAIFIIHLQQSSILMAFMNHSQHSFIIYCIRFLCTSFIVSWRSLIMYAMQLVFTALIS